ncbi:hypothetical protein PANO111632_12515 [Paracoccus nototheniae]|uniref:Uncharacterized protein n=1 Tax=Paracoccus nototheniae TaxID=2489002 RepID=A0ABW4DV77_9RHOB|nr:hypothetical protein [Paracoccus nototheniae]
MALYDAGLKVFIHDQFSLTHAEEGQDKQNDDDKTNDIDNRVHGTFLHISAVTAFHERRALTHHA